jgi:hypothetical protein
MIKIHSWVPLMIRMNRITTTTNSEIEKDIQTSEIDFHSETFLACSFLNPIHANTKPVIDRTPKPI